MFVRIVVAIRPIWKWAILSIVAVPAIVIALAFLGLSSGSGGTSFAAGLQQTTPPTPPTPLGNPTGLTASPGANTGEVLLSWAPAANATIHLVYLMKTGSDAGRYWLPSTGDAASETITGLEPYQEYLFIVIAGQVQSGDSTVEWSQWSKWSRSMPGYSGLPTPPIAPTKSPDNPGPTGIYEGAEIQGVVLSVDSGANTFRVRVLEYEHFRRSNPSSPLTVNYGAVEFVESWLRPGYYVEVEGSYDPANNVLRAYKVEREGGNDDDGDGYDDGDDDNDNDNDNDDDDDDDDDDND